MQRHFGRLQELDALRGLAAIVVATGHFFFGFAPRIHGLESGGLAGAAGTPMFAVFNGSAAVIFFFVLSGFVLASRPLATRELEDIIRPALRRWPRLAGPVVIVSVFSGLIAVLGLYSNMEAGALTGSGWLSSFTFNLPGRPPSIWDATVEGASTFFTGSAFYNAVLWTMFYEFAGSFFVFGLTAILIKVRNTPASIAILCFSYIGSFYVGSGIKGHPAIASSGLYLHSFVIGVAIAYFHTNRPRFWGGQVLPKLRWWIWVLVASFIVFAWGYHGASGFYNFLDSTGALLAVYGIPLQQVLHSAAAILIMWCAINVASLQNLLKRPAMAALGAMSFPIYLTHLVVFCSISAWLFVLLWPVLGAWTFVPVYAITIALVGTFSYVIALFDGWWVAAIKAVHLPNLALSRRH